MDSPGLYYNSALLPQLAQVRPDRRTWLGEEKCRKMGAAYWKAPTQAAGQKAPPPFYLLACFYHFSHHRGPEWPVFWGKSPERLTYPPYLRDRILFWFLRDQIALGQKCCVTLHWQDGIFPSFAFLGPSQGAQETTETNVHGWVSAPVRFQHQILFHLQSFCGPDLTRLLLYLFFESLWGLSCRKLGDLGAQSRSIQCLYLREWNEWVNLSPVIAKCMCKWRKETVVLRKRTTHEWKIQSVKRSPVNGHKWIWATQPRLS